MLPVPTQKEMDELYKEIYLLKKRIKELEKRT
jgi:polyhydroxyalkanoate synthesis regulator phasin